MPGVWVFPGGAVDDEDGPVPDSEEAHRRCAVRELAEEAGMEVDPNDLVAYSRWITPRVVPIRFDTRFYLARDTGRGDPEVDGDEVIDWTWVAPRLAIERHQAGGFELVFPTIKHLESLYGFETVDQAFEAAAGIEVRAVEPTIEMGEDGRDARLAFDEAESDQPGTHPGEIDSKPPPGEL